MNIQQVRQEVWYALSVVIMAVVVSNFGLQKLSKISPDLLEIVLGSTKLDRFAEAVGYYTPIVNADSVVRAVSDPSTFTIDVLENDTFGSSSYGATSGARIIGFLLDPDSPATGISNVVANPANLVSVTEVDTPLRYSGTDRARKGEVQVSVSNGYEGRLTFDYTTCTLRGDQGRGNECLTAPVTVQIGAINEPPEIRRANVFTQEDTAYRFEVNDFDENSNFGRDLEGYSDPEDTPYTRVRIESLPLENGESAGILTYDGNELTSADLPLEIGRDDVTKLSYTPRLNYSNEFSSNVAVFDFNARDDIQYALGPGPMELVVGSLNDAPEVEDFTVEFAHDTSWYFNMPSDADNNCFSARYSDVDAQTRGFNEAWELGGLRLMSEPEHGELFVYPGQDNQYGAAGEPYAWTEGRVIARDDIDSMRFIPEPGYVGTDTFEWQATDELITESGFGGPAINYAWSNTATTTLNITNTPPSLGDVTFDVGEDSVVEFELSRFAEAFSDAEDDPLTAIRLGSLPTNGDLLLDGQEVAVGQEISREDINKLRFTPEEDFNGTVRFDYNATDGYDYAAEDREVFLRIGPVDDIPVASDFSFETGFNTIYSFRVEDGETLFEENFVDEADEATQAGDEDYFLAEIEIVTLPRNGRLGFTRQSDGAEVTVDAGQRILASELDSVIYAPENGFSGQDAFTWRGYEIDQQEQVIAVETNLRPQEISNVATASVTVANYENLRIAITKDTPDEEVEINKIVCVEGEITNPNDFPLENAVVRLTTDPSKAPFVENSFTLPAGKTYKNLNVTNAEFSLTLDRIEAQESVVLGNCVRPLVRDLSTIDGVTFLEGSDRVTEGEVSIKPVDEVVEPVAEPEVVTLEEKAELLVRTGGRAQPLVVTTGVPALILAALWVGRRWQKK